MKPTILFLLTLALTATAFADPVAEVAAAETAFAKAFADRDKAKFFAMVAPDANFLGPAGTLRGKEAVIAGWSPLLLLVQAPFSWGPERVEVTADGKLGLSTGPIYDPQGKHAGDYSSIWQKQADGSWKVLFDGPGSAPAQVSKVEEGFVKAGDGTKLYYRKFGNGPVTIIAPLDSFLHEHFRQLANLATVVTYDVRNRGRSDRAKDASTWTIQQDVKDLEAVRRELKIEKFIPIGFSYTGLMVAMYALDHPDRVTRIVQLGPDFALVRALDLTERVKDIKVPVLTIHSDKDPDAPYAGSVAWVQALPDAKLVTVKGAAHAAWLDDPVTVFASIRHFIRGEWPLATR